MFNHWKNGQRDVELDENSESHISACLAFAPQRGLIGCVDKEQEKAILNESKYWLSVLQRTVNVVKFLAERGLPLRGHEEKFGSVHNGSFY